MKSLKTISLILLLNLAYPAFSSSAYLSVPKWESCTKIFEKGPYKLFCLPPEKPATCPDSSWKSLYDKHLLPLCPLCPPKT